MPYEAPSSAIYRPDLGMAVMEYSDQINQQLIGLRVMPIYRTPDESAVYPVIPKEVMLKIYDTSRAARGNYNRADWAYENGLYKTYDRGWEEPIDDTERNRLNRRQAGLADYVATRRAMNMIQRGQEKRIASKVFNASAFTAHAVTNEWDDAANATPIDDVNDAVLAFRNQCGMLPDVLVITFYTFVKLKTNAQIVNQLKYTFPGIDINRMTSAQLAAIFNVGEVLVAGGVYDAAGAGLDASITDIWDNEYAALLKISRDENDIAEPGFGRTFLWTEDSPQDPVVEQYREDKIRSDVYRVRHNVEECYIRSYDSSGTVVSDIAAACIYLLSNITTK